jgi:hypothetical protein
MIDYKSPGNRTAKATKAKKEEEGGRRRKKTGGVS